MGRYGREERSKFEGKKRKDGFSCPTVSLNISIQKHRVDEITPDVF